MRLNIINLRYACLPVFIFLMLITATNMMAQTQNFSFTQYMNNLTPLNPAYSLVGNTGSVNTQLRQQWAGVDGAPVTYLINGNLPIPSMNSAAGLSVLEDKFAIEHQVEINAYFAKAIQLGEKQNLGVAINAGIRNYTANFSQLDPTQLDPVFRNDVRSTRPNLGFGVMYFTDWYYLGLSAPELSINSLGTASAQDPVNFRNHYYFSAAALTSMNDDIKFKGSTLLSYANGVPLIADLSGIFYFKEVLGVGLSYRTSQELAGIVTINYNSFQLGYSYQSGTSGNNLGNYNVATHEITFSYRFGKDAAKAKLL